MSAFHDVRLPMAFALGATGGPVRRTDVVQLASGREYRNSPWSGSRRRWDIGGAVKSAEQLEELTAFFEARGGQLYGFRLRDPSDYSSASHGADNTSTDQHIGTGDGLISQFQLVKHVTSGGVEYVRRITRPVAGTVSLAIDGVEQTSGWSVDVTTGFVRFDTPPASNTDVTAGFDYDLPVRFDADQLDISLDVMGTGRIVSVPVIELIE